MDVDEINRPPSPVPKNRVPRGNRRGRNRRNRVRVGQNVAPKPPRHQKYRRAWELDEERRRWLRPVRNNVYRARCTLCNVTLAAHLNTINRHHTSNAHHIALYNALGPDNNQYETEEEFEREKARIINKLGAYFSKKDLPAIHIEGLLPVILDVSKNRRALESLSLGRNTFTKVITNVMADCVKEELHEILLNTKFSILFDESTDIATEKHGAVLVRYFDKKIKKTVTSLWSLVAVYEDEDENSAATAAVLYQRIMESFNNFEEIPKSNVTAFISDGCNTMTGMINGVFSFFKRDFPHIITLVCPCHAVQLCAKDAAANIPKEVIDFPRDVYNFMNTPKRKFQLKQHQIALNKDVQNLLQSVLTRWLSAGPCIDRLIEQWEPVKETLIFFKNENNQAAAKLLERMEKPETKCYLFFLSNILPTLENLNGWLQTERVILPEVFPEISESYLDILDTILDEEYLKFTSLDEIDLKSIENFKELSQTEISEIALEEVLNLDDENWYSFMQNWKEFEPLQCLLKKNALSQDFHDNNPDMLQEVMVLCIRALPDEDNDTLDSIFNEWDDPQMFKCWLGFLLCTRTFT